MPTAERRQFLYCLGLAAFAGARRRRQTDPTLVRSCRTIDAPGRYALGSDIEDTSGGGQSTDPCIEVSADDVVLDGRGFAVSTENRAPAVRVTGRNVTVENVGDLFGEPALALAGASRCLVRRNAIGDLEDGIVVRNGTENRIVDNDIDGPDFDCISLDGAAGTEVSGNRLDGEYGVRLSNCDGTLVANNTLVENEEGIRFSQSSGTTVRGNEVRAPLGTGIRADESRESTVVDNRVTGGSEGFGADLFGIDVTDSTGIALRQNVSRDHERAGIRLSDTDRANVVRNWARNNGVGIGLRNCADCGVVENVACGNAAAGIRIDDDSTGVDRRDNTTNCGPGRILEVVPLDVACSYRAEVMGSFDSAAVRGRELNPDDEIAGGTLTGQVFPGSDGDAARFTGDIVELVVRVGNCQFLVDGETASEAQQSRALEVVPVGAEASYRVTVSGTITPAEINDREANPDDVVEGDTVTGNVFPGSDGDAFRFTGDIVELVVLNGDMRFLVDGSVVAPTG